MSNTAAIATMFELAAILLIIWGLCHENKFVRFEDKLAKIIANVIIRHRRKHRLHKLSKSRTNSFPDSKVVA